MISTSQFALLFSWYCCWNSHLHQHMPLSDTTLSLFSRFKQVRERNLVQTGDTASFGQVLENCTVRRCWREVLEQSDYDARRAAVQKFNRYVNGDDTDNNYETE